MARPAGLVHSALGIGAWCLLKLEGLSIKTWWGAAKQIDLRSINFKYQNSDFTMALKKTGKRAKALDRAPMALGPSEPFYYYILPVLVPA